MRKFLTLVAIATTLASAQAQRVQVDVTHSFEKQTGIDVYKVTESGFVYGVGGSYMFSTYTGETKGKYQELATVYLGNNITNLSPAFRSAYINKNFIEDRGSVRVLLGQSFKYTTVYAMTGISFRSEYWAGTGYDMMPGFTSPQKNFYIYRNIPPRIMYGLTVSQLVTRDLGMNLGWNSISGVTYGISFNLKHARLFQD